MISLCVCPSIFDYRLSVRPSNLSTYQRIYLFLGAEVLPRQRHNPPGHQAPLRPPRQQGEQCTRQTRSVKSQVSDKSIRSRIQVNVGVI